MDTFHFGINVTGQKFYKRLSLILLAIAAVISCLVLTGWFLEIRVLKSVFPNFITMKANTAAGLLLTTIAIFGFHFPQRPRLAKAITGIASGLVLMLAITTIMEYVLGQNLGVDELLANDPDGFAGKFPPGRLAPITALNFILLSLSFLRILLNDSERAIRQSQILVFFAFLISFQAFAGYLVGVTYSFGSAFYTQMAIHTAFSFLCLCIAAWSRFSQSGYMRIFTSQRVSGRLTRQLLITIVVAPPLVNWLTTIGLEAGLYDSDFAILSRVVANIVLMSLVVWRNALVLFETEEMKESAQKRLAESELRYRLMAESIPQLLWESDPHGKILFVNQRWKDYTGMDPSKHAEHGNGKTVHPDESPRILKLWRNSLLTGIPFEAEYRIHRSDHSYEWHLARSLPIRNEEGTILRWIGTATNIEIQRQAAESLTRSREDLEKLVVLRTEELVAANRELEAFSYSVAHDLRAPLRSVDGFSRHVLQRCRGALDNQSIDELTRIRDSAKKMGQLIDDLLRLSQLGRKTLKKQDLNLTEISLQVWKELQAQDPSRKVELQVPEGLTAYGDAELIKVVLMNLLGNSWKYTSKKPNAQVEIGRRLERGKEIFYVRDNGAGFDMAYVRKLFGAFQRLHSDSEFEGTGIGLATVRRIIERLGGETWAEGKVNEGATISFTLGKS